MQQLPLLIVLWMLHPGASYCGGTLGHGVTNWNCYACKRHPNVNATVVSNQTLFFDFNSFVAYDGDTNRVILAIAGTGKPRYTIQIL